MNSIIYKNVRDLANLQNNTYLLAIIVAVIALLIAAVIANMIAYEGGLTPRDHIKRTWAYWLVGIVAAIGFFIYNYFVVAPQVSTAFRPDFEQIIYIATLITFGVYVVAGLVLGLLLKNSKFGTIKFKP